MKTTIFLLGLIIGGVGVFAGAIYLENGSSLPTNEIVFGPKMFVGGTGVLEGLITVTGTLTGEGMAYPNNTYTITCSKRQVECFVATVAQIGANQVGRVYDCTYPIVEWNDAEIVASSTPGIGCMKVTITLSRKEESVLWVEEPANETRMNCRNADSRVRKYTIEDSPALRKLHGK